MSELKLVSDSESPEGLATRHAKDMKLLMGRMLQVAAGGGGIGEIGELLVRACNSFMAIANSGHTTADCHAVHAVKRALQPDFPFNPNATFHSFSYHRPAIVQKSLQVAAHNLLGNSVQETNAGHRLHDAVKAMIEHR